MYRSLRPWAVLSAFGCVVALAVASSVGAAASGAWVFTGHSVGLDAVTHQPLVMNVVLSPDGKSVKTVSFAESYHCGPDDDYTSWTRLSSMPIAADGSFGKTSHFTDSTVTISGRMNSAGAGVSVSSVDSDSCRSIQSYRLTRGAGSYGGDTTQDRPISLKLKGNHKAIGELTVYWKAACATGAGKSVTHFETSRLTNIPLNAHGAFAKSGTYAYTYGGTGVPFAVKYTLKGIVTATNATGTLSVSASAGANGLVEQCPTVSFGFTALSA